VTNEIGDRQVRTDIEMQVVARDGSVWLLFNEEDRETKAKRAAYTPNFILSASDALTLSALIADLAFETDSGLKAPASVKAELIERHRKTLSDRLTVVLNSMREKKTTSNRQLAKQVVDICMREVFA
jgi:hypothetical protein